MFFLWIDFVLWLIGGALCCGLLVDFVLWLMTGGLCHSLCLGFFAEDYG